MNDTPEILPKELSLDIARRGKWTIEEERFTERIIHDFENGTLAVPDGTTLRTFLSKSLNCDPMRITKKFTGESCIGKRVFVAQVQNSINAAAIQQAQKELKILRQTWVERLLGMERENARKLCIKSGTNNSGLKTKYTINYLASVEDEEISSVNANNSYNEEKIRLALKAFVPINSDVDQLISWLKRSNDAISFSSSFLELDALAKLGEMIVTSVHLKITENGYTDNNYDDSNDDDYDEEDNNKMSVEYLEESVIMSISPYYDDKNDNVPRKKARKSPNNSMKLKSNSDSNNTNTDTNSDTDNNNNNTSNSTGIQYNKNTTTKYKTKNSLKITKDFISGSAKMRMKSNSNMTTNKSKASGSNYCKKVAAYSEDGAVTALLGLSNM